MNKNDILSKMSKTFSKVSFSAKKHSPEILVVTGVVGVVTAAVMACRATTNINDILEEEKETIETIDNFVENETRDYSEEDGKKDLALVHIQTGIKFVRLYTPAVTVGVISLACILASNDILRKRNVALAAAYAAVDKGFKDYRKSVIEKFGETVDKEHRYNIKAKEFEDVIVDENTGDSQSVSEKVNVVGIDGYSDYARFFDSSSRNWSKNSEDNLYFLRAEQNYANDRLKARDYLFLNEVYERLDIPTTRAGQIVGWVYDPKNPDIDNFVDFGIYETNRETNRDFINGYEPVILLDFNVDGNILDLMK
ncbi:MAG: DUF6353 family protein [Clostridiales bacterium]|nr:DUF6353 family protein [Clostridiales bacterium]